MKKHTKIASYADTTTAVNMADTLNRITTWGAFETHSDLEIEGWTAVVCSRPPTRTNLAHVDGILAGINWAAATQRAAC